MDRPQLRNEISTTAFGDGQRPVWYLNGVGLISPARFLRSGGIVGWGRRPWLAPRVARLFLET